VRSSALRILLAVPRYPFPPRRGDQLRTVQALHALGSRYRVTVLAPEPPPGAPSPELPGVSTETVHWVHYRPPGPLGRLGGLARAAASGRPFQSGLFDSTSLATAFAHHLPRADLAILQLVRLAPSLEGLAGGTPVLVDLIDSLALSTARRAGFDRAWLAPVLRAEARRLRRWEGRLVDRAELTLVVSERDRQALVAQGDSIEGSERVRVVPVAVGGGATDAESEHLAKDPEKRVAPETLVVTGNLGYFPTLEGLRWLLAEVWPRLRRARPGLRLVLAGSRPPRSLAREAERSGAELLADPPDLRSILADATVALAPMRCGAGQPLKVLEAWAAGVPVVTTSWTAAGTSGRVGRELVVADGVEEWTGAVLELLDDPERRQRLAHAARLRLAADYSPGTVREAWLEAVRSAVSASSGGGTGRSATRAARSRA
jgi:glycosyltransferase involved in cell wall biosynthesis